MSLNYTLFSHSVFIYVFPKILLDILEQISLLCAR